MSKATPGAVRGCGTRTEGGLYLEVGLSRYGWPVEYFLSDPPHPYEPDVKIGQQIVERGETHHIIDWVGEQHYPYPVDIIEEIRRYGLSRKVSPNADLHLLDENSRILLVHAKGLVSNTGPLKHQTEWSTEKHNLGRYCVQKRFHANDLHIRRPEGPCSRMHWLYAPPNTESLDAAHYRENGSVRFTIYAPFTDGNWDVLGPTYEPAIIASFPITRFALIRAQDGSHAETAQKVRGKLGAHELGLEDE